MRGNEEIFTSLAEYLSPVTSGETYRSRLEGWPDNGGPSFNSDIVTVTVT